MGWTSYHAEYYKNGKIDRKAECDNLFKTELNADKTRMLTNLASRMDGAVYYAAIESKSVTDENDRRVFAIVCLTRIDNNEYCNFSYKDMDESCGPCYYRCPAKILNLLTPTDNEYANAWRKECRKILMRYNSPTALHRLPEGSIVRFNAPFDLKVAKKGDTVEVHKTKIGKSYRWTNGMYYYQADVIGDEYEVIRIGF